MKIERIVFFIIFGIAAVQAQNSQVDVRSLENDFKSFEYKRVLEKGKFMLADPFTNREDSLGIYQLMLSSAYALSDTITARQLVIDILKCEPRFAPNPRDTSPKIIEFFNYVKSQVNIDRVENEVTRSDSLTLDKTSAFKIKSALLASVILPGSGQLIMGDTRTGILRTSVSAVIAGLYIYSAIHLNDSRKEYINARGEADYDKLYNKYNQYYKIRTGTLIFYALWSLYNLYEIDTQFPFAHIYYSGNRPLSLTLTYHF